MQIQFLNYEQQAYRKLLQWQKKMLQPPSLLDGWSKNLQAKVNSYIPPRVHSVITSTIKHLVKGILFGATFTSKKSTLNSLQNTEEKVFETIANYRRTASVEGGLTGAGGFIWGMVDFPVLAGIKIKMLFDIASLYGFDVKDYKERLYILHIFQLAFSSAPCRKKVYLQMQNWNDKKESLPNNINDFNWEEFQQEYRDYIDLAKMAQLIPGIGAAVGIVANYRLVNLLGKTAVNAYRMRLLNKNSKW